MDDASGELGVPTRHADVDRPDQVAPRELDRVPGVEHHGSPPLPTQHIGHIQRIGNLLLVEEGTVLPVEAGVVGEVGGGRGLALGHHAHELLPGHVG